MAKLNSLELFFIPSLWKSPKKPRVNSYKIRSSVRWKSSSTSNNCKCINKPIKRKVTINNKGWGALKISTMNSIINNKKLHKGKTTLTLTSFVTSNSNQHHKIFVGFAENKSMIVNLIITNQNIVEAARSKIMILFMKLSNLEIRGRHSLLWSIGAAKH